MRRFALEYFRQFGNADMIHFYSRSKKSQLKIRHQLGPFIFNKREEAWKEAEKMLRDFLQLKTSFYWAPYDPNHFISLRRIKYKLAGYDHFSIPQIEKYANHQEWAEGTLVEDYCEEELVEKAIKNLEKTVDLESFGQVFFAAPAILEKAPHLPSSPRNLPKQVSNQQLQIKEKKCSIQKNKPTTWDSKKK